MILFNKFIKVCLFSLIVKTPLSPPLSRGDIEAGEEVENGSALGEIEKNTVQGNAWGSFSLNVSSGLCKVAGQAPTYSLVAKQAVAFKRAGFLNIDFNDLKLNKEGGVSFDAEFVFGSAFKKKPATLSE